MNIAVCEDNERDRETLCAVFGNIFENAARFEDKDGVFYSRVLLRKTPPPSGE